MMALADIGGQPRKLAMEIHRQLRLQFGTVPLRVPLEGIAQAIGIVEIAEHETEAFEGTLLVKGDKGAIALRRGMRSGRRRFTLGHELGHFVNPWHRTSGNRFECSGGDMRRKRDRATEWDSRPQQERMEIEANEFSAALLLPAPEFKDERAKFGKDPAIADIAALAKQFDVSLEFMASTYVDTSKHMIGIILSQHGCVTRPILKKDFPFLGLRKGAPLPHDSRTVAFRRRGAPGDISSAEDVLRTGWLENRGRVTALTEQVMLQQDGWAVTLLWADEEDDDPDDDDRNWNRRSSRRWEN